MANTEQMVELCEDVRKLIIDKTAKMETLTLAIYGERCGCRNDEDKKPYYVLEYTFTRQMRAPEYHMEFIDYRYVKETENGGITSVSPKYATITTERLAFIRNEGTLEYLCRMMIEGYDWLHCVVIQDGNKPKSVVSHEEMWRLPYYSVYMRGHDNIDMDDMDENDKKEIAKNVCELKELVEAFIAKA